jgi:hypothetical protein
MNRVARTRRLLLVSGTMALTTVGCGGTRTRPGTPAAPTVRSSVSQLGPLLQVRTARPPDVAAQFDYVGGAGPGTCDASAVVAGPTAAPSVKVSGQPFPAMPDRPSGDTTSQHYVTFGQAVDVCFNGFGRGPVRVKLGEPDGHEVIGLLHQLAPSDVNSGAAQGWAPFDWVPDLEPTWPVGLYTVSASARDLHATTSFVLVTPSEPGLRVLGPSTDPGNNTVPPNSQARIFVVGFPADQRLRLVVYRTAGPGSVSDPYFSSTEITLPKSGNLAVTVPTGNPNPASTFVITAHFDGITLFGAFNVSSPADPSVVVGPLPSS